MEENNEIIEKEAIKDAKYTVGNLSPSILSSLKLVRSNCAAINLTLTKLVLSYHSKVTLLSSTVQSILDCFLGIDYSPFKNIQNFIKGFNFLKYRKELDDIYLQELINAKWFPVRITMVSAEFFSDIIHILGTTKASSKNRLKKIDKVFFNYYNENTLKELRMFWKSRNLPNHIKRILFEAIQAYKRRQYALTLSALVSLWQGIIQEKATANQSGKTDKKTKEEFQQLITENECNNLVQYYFEEYIFYPCYGVEQAKEDVPGRNSVCHSWYHKYPTRKAALNAIIFTDFLLELEPVKKENNNG